MPDSDTLFAVHTYSISALSFATALASLAIACLGAGVLARGYHIPASRAFFLITVAYSGWLFCWAAMYGSPNSLEATAWARTGFLFGALIPPAVFHFATNYATDRPRYGRLAALSWVLCAAIAAAGVATPVFIHAVRRMPWGFYPIGGAAAGTALLLFAAVIIGSFHLFWRVYRRTEGKERERAAALLLALILGSFGMLDYLPTVGIELQPVGYVTALAFVVVAATAAWRFELADITPEFAAGQILETIKNAVVVSDLDGRIRVANRGAERLLGYSAGELRDTHLRQIFDQQANLTTTQLIHSTGVLEHAMVWRAADGSAVDVLAASSFVRDGEGTPVGVVYVASDFTERKRAEQALRESESRYRTLFENNPLPMWVYDVETLRFTAVNDAAVRHYGYARDEFLRMTIADIRPPEAIPAMLDALSHLDTRRGPFHFLHRKKDGSVIDVDITSFEFVSGSGRSRLVIAQDITERKRAEQELQKSEERYRELFENANDLVYTHDLEGRITSMNVAGERVSGYSREELLGRPIQEVVAPEHLERAREAMERKIRGEATATAYEVDLLAKDGRRIPLELSTRLILRDGKPVGVQGIARDVTDRKESEARYRLLFERNLAGVYRTDAEGRILDCNDACARIFGYESRDELLSSNARHFYFDPNERERLVQILRGQKQISNVELRLRRRDGTPVWVLENVTLLGDVLEGTIIDITDRKRVQEQMEFQAYHDALTGLPNRLLFRDRMTVALAHSRRSSRVSAVMFLDLDQFKHVNDTLGHNVGDRLLQVVGSRLVGCVRAEDTVARMGGDEFTVLLADLNDRRGAAAVAQKILEAMRQPVVIDEHELFVTTSVGIAVYPEDGQEAETLLKNADRAMYRAKAVGRDNYQFATPARLEIAEGRAALERRLWDALEREEFVLHYQPVVEIATGNVVGAEALVRWNDPQHGITQPEDFIAIAEETQLIVPLGVWVLRTACAQMKAWHESGFAGLRLAVNLSTRQFQDRDLVGTVERVLAETGYPAELLDLEITETAAMQNAELSVSILERLKKLGVHVSIDDFGTGYSSLSYLKRLPIDTVKIDREFVRDLTSDDAAIISAVVAMARALRLRVIAEGVETPEQVAFLRREECAEMQGFLYSRPMAAAEFERALAAREVSAHSVLDRLRLTSE